MDETERLQFDYKLELPPPWEINKAPSADALASDAAAFQAAAASFAAMKR